MSDWTAKEVELIIENYFEMLQMELKGIPYNKAEYRRKLIHSLNNRNEGAIEFKHQNISSVLIELGHPYINGYKRRDNYQRLLIEKVIDYLTNHNQIEAQFKNFAERDFIWNPAEINFYNFVEEPPTREAKTSKLVLMNRGPIKTNYLEKEQQNSKLGKSGEETVYKYEKWFLLQAGLEKLAEQVRWISNEEGDGAGFDILSKNVNGTDKYIEVKTTKLRKETPFFFTRNELFVSQKHLKNYHLFRLFNFESKAKMFTINGSLDVICHSTPITFEGYF